MSDRNATLCWKLLCRLSRAAGTILLLVFAFVAPAQAVVGFTAITPTTGASAGGDTVTLTGSFANCDFMVDFGGTAVGPYPRDNNNTISGVVTPAHAPGTVDVTITEVVGGGQCDGESATLPASFTFIASLATVQFGAASQSVTFWPCCASRCASVMPSMPPPITAQCCCLSSGIYGRRGVGG